MCGETFNLYPILSYADVIYKLEFKKVDFTKAVIILILLFYNAPYDTQDKIEITREHVTHFVVGNVSKLFAFIEVQSLNRYKRVFDSKYKFETQVSVLQLVMI